MAAAKIVLLGDALTSENTDNDGIHDIDQHAEAHMGGGPRGRQDASCISFSSRGGEQRPVGMVQGFRQDLANGRTRLS